VCVYETSSGRPCQGVLGLAAQCRARLACAIRLPTASSDCPHTCAHTRRLREGVESVVLLSAELGSLQRQLHSSMELQQAAEHRAKELEQLCSTRNFQLPPPTDGAAGEDPLLDTCIARQKEQQQQQQRQQQQQQQHSPPCGVASVPCMQASFLLPASRNQYLISRYCWRVVRCPPRASASAPVAPKRWPRSHALLQENPALVAARRWPAASRPRLARSQRKALFGLGCWVGAHAWSSHQRCSFTALSALLLACLPACPPACLPARLPACLPFCLPAATCN